jgi:hypothetical protein
LGRSTKLSNPNKLFLKYSQNNKGGGSEMALPFYYPTFDICYISAISKVGPEVVISYSEN